MLNCGLRDYKLSDSLREVRLLKKPVAVQNYIIH